MHKSSIPLYGESRRVIEAAKGSIDLSNQLLFCTTNGGGDDCETLFKEIRAMTDVALVLLVVVDGRVEKQVCHEGPNEVDETMASYLF